MQPPVVTAHDCSLFLCSFKQSKAAVRLKEDMKRVVSRPGRGQPPMPCRKVFGVPLRDLQKEGLLINGVPAVVWNLVEYLRSEGMTHEGLFRVNGNVKVVEQLRVKYESGEPLTLSEDADIHSAASLLKLFLREMPDGVISTALLPKFIQIYQESGSDTQRENSLRELIHELPDTHYSLLKYLCHFLTQVVERHAENKMSIYNLATVFGPNCFHVSPGFEGMKQQEICNKIVAKLLEYYSKFFECEHTEKDGLCEAMARIITVKEYNSEKMLIPTRSAEIEVLPISSRIMDDISIPFGNSTESVPTPLPRKVNKQNTGKQLQEFEVPVPKQSDGIPQASLLVANKEAYSEGMDLVDNLMTSSNDSLRSSQEDERPMSPFFMSGHVAQVSSVPAGRELLERTIRTAVEQHLFDVLGPGSQSSEESESGTSSPSTSLSARQRRRHLKEQDEIRKKPRDM